MLRNYFRVALRSFSRSPLHTVIHVTGLAAGMAVCILIVALVHHEWRFDRYHEASDRIFRTWLAYEAPDGTPGVQAMMPPDFTPSLQDTYPDITHATRLVQNTADLHVASNIHRTMLAEVDPDFFDMFSVDIVAGGAAREAGSAAREAGGQPQLLTAPEQIVVSRSTATAWYGSAEDAIGGIATIRREDFERDFEVVAVFEDFPAWSSIAFDAAISFENYDPIQLGGNNWGGRTSTYVRLADGAGPAALEERFHSFTSTFFGEYIADMQEAGYLARVGTIGDAVRGASAGAPYALRLQPLPELHRTPDVWAPYERSIHNPLYSWILGGIGLVILGIACINFMTLSVARSAVRAREVGVRKVLGADRWSIMRQYWGEALLLSLVSLGAGLLLARALQPLFGQLAGVDISVFGLPPALTISGIVLLVLVVGGLAGAYPAAILSAFEPARVLKGDTPRSGSGLVVRSLVVLQYTISIGLMASLFVMQEQVGLLLEKDLGFDDDRVVAIEARQIDSARAEAVVDAFRQEVMQGGAVDGVARAGQAFTRSSDRNGWRDAEGIQRQAYNFGVSYEYIDVMGMDIVDGRNFSRDYPADPTQSVLVNEALVREFGLENPVGQQLNGWLDWIYETPPTIIGVVSDFNFQSLHNEVQPAVMNMHPDYYNYLGAILVRIPPGRTADALTSMQHTWNTVMPGTPYAWAFVSDDMKALYETEARWQRIVSWSSALALFIASMGLFALALMTVAGRVREIGIRKVLGASERQVMTLVTREFAVLVLVSSLLAAPMAWFAMQKWLDNFAYRVELGPLPFLFASGAALLLAILTVAWHALSAARMNPVTSLNRE